MGDKPYKEIKKRVENILNSKTEIRNVESISDDESGFTYGNGVRTMIASLFVDIRNSTSLFKNENPEIIARIMRAFTSEIIGILMANSSYVQIGIRGDCVYAIYSAPIKQNFKEIMLDAFRINTFQKMFQHVLLKKEWPTFLIGIGLGASKDLVIKAGKKGTGINDNIWIGDAVVDASKLSDEGSIDEIGPIVMDECFYVNIKDFYVNSKEKYGDCLQRFHSAKLGAVSYHCDRVMSDFDDWIDREFNI